MVMGAAFMSSIIFIRAASISFMKSSLMDGLVSSSLQAENTISPVIIISEGRCSTFDKFRAFKISFFMCLPGKKLIRLYLSLGEDLIHHYHAAPKAKFAIVIDGYCSMF